MSEPDARAGQVFLDLYDRRTEYARAILTQLVAPDELERALADARSEFEAMASEIPYADRPGHVMFGPSFGVFQALAVYKAAARRGLDVHAVGRAVLAVPTGGEPESLPEGALPKLEADAKESQESAAPNEFVFEIVPGDADTDWGMNVISCAVCHAFARHDAMDLVPYMCATDDVVSDAGGQGLRRTGTIGLGAHRCDFRYKAGGEPNRLVEQYPDRIQIESEKP